MQGLSSWIHQHVWCNQLDLYILLNGTLIDLYYKTVLFDGAVLQSDDNMVLCHLLKYIIFTIFIYHSIWAAAITFQAVSAVFSSLACYIFEYLYFNPQYNFTSIVSYFSSRKYTSNYYFLMSSMTGFSKQWDTRESWGTTEKFRKNSVKTNK